MSARRSVNGGPARGVCPIKAGESVTMVALLDFDSHKGEVSWAEMSAVVARVVDVLELVHGMHPILFRARAAWACTCISFGTRRKTPTPCGAS